MAESFHPSQDIICAETYNDVVQELGTDGTDLIQAVEEDETVFVIMVLPIFIKSVPKLPEPSSSPQESLIPSALIKSEPTEFQDDQNSNWNERHQYYNEQQIVYPQPTLQQPIAQIPANVDYAGDLDFDILINSLSANRNSWIYSPILKKVFINMQNVLPIDVKRNPCNTELFLRATLLFSLPQYTQEIVERCSTHVDPRMSTNRDVNPMVMKHVLRCNNRGSIYVGSTDYKQHLSVITPLDLPQAGMDTVRVNYQFMCKNSCPSGMNRRAVDVIFTLEDRHGHVLGRRKLAVRVCSCPKRDKEKEEKEFRDNNNQNPPTYTRKRKHSALRPKIEPNLSVNDGSVYELPALKIYGRQTAINMLKLARDSLFFEISNTCLDENQLEKARESFDDVSNALKNLAPQEE